MYTYRLKRHLLGFGVSLVLTFSDGEIPEICVQISMTVSTQNATPPKSTRSKKSDSSVSRGTNSNWDLVFYWGLWGSRFGGFQGCRIFSGICDSEDVNSLVFFSWHKDRCELTLVSTAFLLELKWIHMDPHLNLCESLQMCEVNLCTCVTNIGCWFGSQVCLYLDRPRACRFADVSCESLQMCDVNLLQTCGVNLCRCLT